MSLRRVGACLPIGPQSADVRQSFKEECQDCKERMTRHGSTNHQESRVITVADWLVLNQVTKE